MNLKDAKPIQAGISQVVPSYLAEYSASSHLAILLINDELKPMWCEPEGRTVILNNQDNDDVSSLTFTDFTKNGLAFLPNTVMVPLANISAMTSQKNYELRVVHSH